MLGREASRSHAFSGEEKADLFGKEFNYYVIASLGTFRRHLEEKLYTSLRAQCRGGLTLPNRTQCLMSQQFLLRRECMDKSKSLLQQNQMEIGEVMLLPGCTLTETY